MKYVPSTAGAIALSLLPLLLDQDAQPAQTPAEVRLDREDATPYDVTIYLLETTTSDTQRAEDVMNDLADCIGTCYQTLASKRGPIRDTRQALDYFYPGAVEQLSLEDRYYLEWDGELMEFVYRCEKKASFSVTTDAGRVGVLVSEHNM